MGFIWHWECCMLVKVCVFVCVCYAWGWVGLRRAVSCDAWTRYYEHRGIGGSEEDTVCLYRRRECLIFEHCAAVMLSVRDWLYLSWSGKGMFDWALCCSNAVGARLTVPQMDIDWALCCSNAVSARRTSAGYLIEHCAAIILSVRDYLSCSESFQFW
jgi:hypothetical protein